MVEKTTQAAKLLYFPEATFLVRQNVTLPVLGAIFRYDKSVLIQGLTKKKSPLDSLWRSADCHCVHLILNSVRTSACETKKFDILSHCQKGAFGGMGCVLCNGRGCTVMQREAWPNPKPVGLSEVYKMREFRPGATGSTTATMPPFNHLQREG